MIKNSIRLYTILLTVILLVSCSSAQNTDDFGNNNQNSDQGSNLGNSDKLNVGNFFFTATSFHDSNNEEVTFFLAVLDPEDDEAYQRETRRIKLTNSESIKLNGNSLVYSERDKYDDIYSILKRSHFSGDVFYTVSIPQAEDYTLSFTDKNGENITFTYESDTSQVNHLSPIDYTSVETLFAAIELEISNPNYGWLKCNSDAQAEPRITNEEAPTVIDFYLRSCNSGYIYPYFWFELISNFDLVTFGGQGRMVTVLGAYTWYAKLTNAIVFDSFQRADDLNLEDYQFYGIRVNLEKPDGTVTLSCGELSVLSKSNGYRKINNQKVELPKLPHVNLQELSQIESLEESGEVHVSFVKAGNRANLCRVTGKTTENQSVIDLASEVIEEVSFPSLNELYDQTITFSGGQLEFHIMDTR